MAKQHAAQREEPAAAAIAPERRVAVRYFCDQAASGSALPAPRRIWGTVRDLCAHGTGLVLARSFAPASSLIIEVMDRDGASVCELPARVIYAIRHASGRWSIGCEFDTPLSNAGLHALLKALA